MDSCSVCDDTDIFSFLEQTRFSKGKIVISSRNFLSDTSVQGFMFKEQYRIGIFKSSCKQAFCVIRKSRIYYFQSGSMGKPGFVCLTVKRTGPYSAATRHADNHICFFTPTVVNLSQIIDNRIETR